MPIARFVLLALLFSGLVAGIDLQPSIAADAAPSAEAAAEAKQEAALLQRLRALGYVEWSEVPEGEAGGSGVVRSEPGSQRGLLFYHSRTRSRAHLLTADGRLLHTWRGPETPGGWHHVELLPDGGLLVVRRDGVLARMDWSSEPVWERNLAAHHDTAVGADGSIHVLTHELSETELDGQRLPVVEDFVTTLSAEGNLLGRISLLDLLRDRVPLVRLRAIAAAEPTARHETGRPLHGLVDVLHANTVEWLPRDVPGLGRRGDLLVGLRELDLVAVLDVRAGRIGWSFGAGELDRPHQPTLLANGNVLAFDNGPSRGWSRVVEIDPGAREIVWQYGAPPAERFYTEKMGGCQGLPNGNALITESARGRAFEVDREGNVVWEFRNPELDALGKRRAAIHRLSKLTPGQVPVLLRMLGETIRTESP